jgi:3-oxoacyl-[acyl-carrier-protein] synthase-3
MDFSPLTIRSADMSPRPDVIARLLARLRQVREQLGQEPLAFDAGTRFGDVLDSMGFVEFLTLASEDCGVSVETIEQATGRRYGSVGELAVTLDRVEAWTSRPQNAGETPTFRRSAAPSAWLAATAVGLPVRRQPASAINACLHRPLGWLEEHAGIEARCLWSEEDPLDTSARTAQDCFRQAGLSPSTIDALLVTSEAPPLLTGLAAALHSRLGLPSDAAALEIGGACTSFLAALWTARRLLIDASAVIVIAVEAPSRWLSLSPSPAGGAAALFGDAAAACLLTARPLEANTLRLSEIVLGTDGNGGPLLRVDSESGRGVGFRMDGIALAHRAIRTMAGTVQQLCTKNGLTVEQIAAIIAHGGNGRMPALLARRLGLRGKRIYSETARTGNLGSASLPVAWSTCDRSTSHPVIWTAAGAGLQWGAALFDWNE